ncbi:MAG: hypothetical protein AB7S38_39890 [Vulcanimicrobiota bacterium]
MQAGTGPLEALREELHEDSQVGGVLKLAQGFGAAGADELRVSIKSKSLILECRLAADSPLSRVGPLLEALADPLGQPRGPVRELATGFVLLAGDERVESLDWELTGPDLCQRLVFETGRAQLAPDAAGSKRTSDMRSRLTVNMKRYKLSVDTFLLYSGYELKERCRHGGWSRLAVDNQTVPPYWVDAAKVETDHWSRTLSQPFALLERYVVADQGLSMAVELGDFAAHGPGLYFWQPGGLRALFSRRQGGIAFVREFVDAGGQPVEAPRGPFAAAAAFAAGLSRRAGLRFVDSGVVGEEHPVDLVPGFRGLLPRADCQPCPSGLRVIEDETFARRLDWCRSQVGAAYSTLTQYKDFYRPVQNGRPTEAMVGELRRRLAETYPLSWD